MVECYYVVRYLPVKQAGLGEFVMAFTSESEPTLDILMDHYPENFNKDGHYTVMKSINLSGNVKAGELM